MSVIACPKGFELRECTSYDLETEYNQKLGTKAQRTSFEPLQFDAPLTQIWENELHARVGVVKNSSTALVLPMQAVDYVCGRKLKTKVLKYHRKGVGLYYASSALSLVTLSNDSDIYARNRFLKRERFTATVPSLLSLAGYRGELFKVRGSIKGRRIGEDQYQYLHVYTESRHTFGLMPVQDLRKSA